MITVFHVLPIMGLALGAVGGSALGGRFGSAVGIVGGVLGAGVGLVCGRLPLFLVLRSIRRDLSNKTTEQLRGMLRDPGILAPNTVLLELGSRGEDLKHEMPLILDMLVAPDRQKRVRGWHALESAFPSQAKMIRDYRIDDALEKSRTKIQRLRGAELRTPPNGGPGKSRGSSGASDGPPSVS